MTFKKIATPLLFIAIPILAIIVWYSPIIFKGYPTILSGSDSLVKARNLSLTEKYSSENEHNVILASDLINTQGQESNYGNKLGTILRGYTQKIIPVTTINQTVLLNCLILSLALLFFTLATNYLFNLKTVLIFALIYIFLPFNWLLPQNLVGYEFALLFLSLFILLFSLGTKKFNDLQGLKKIKFWPHGFYLIFSGIFLILSCLSREAFFLILPLLFIFLLFLKQWRQLLYLFIPIIIIFCFTWLPDFLSNKNTYLLFFTTKTDTTLKGSDYSYYAHIFPDPYNYHLINDQVIANKKNMTDTDFMAKLGREKVLANMGQGSINFFDRFKLGTTLGLRHIFRFFSITEFGGPLIFILFFLGFLTLKEQKKYWFNWQLVWLIGSIFLLAFINLAGRNHLMDWGWIIALDISLGLIFLSEIITSKTGYMKYFWPTLITILVIYNLILCSHVMFGNAYDKATMPKINYYVEKIKSANLKSTDIVALPLGADEIYTLNFLTNKSVITFKEETINNLLSQNKINDAFAYFQVNYISGYSQELSQKIIKAMPEIKIITDNTVPTEQVNYNKNNKNWLLNLIK